MTHPIKKTLSIDSTNGGNGDIWMRLVSFYAMAGILPHLCFQIVIPPFLRPLAQYSFGDRLDIINHEPYEASLTYTTRGIKDLIGPILKGKKFIAPYQRAVIHDKKKKELKDVVNAGIFNVADLLGVVQIPNWKWITAYQGYLDIIGIQQLKKVSYETYVKQLEWDSSILYSRLQGDIPLSPQLQIPEDLKNRVLVFPTGTSRQFVPLWWAKQYLPNAYYAFFYKDEEAKLFSGYGLNVLLYYKEPGDIIKLSQKAGWTISTDSFSSHLLQYASKRCTITITEVLSSRIISPVFRGKIVQAVAPCHPCLHLDRKNHPLCAAGYMECINWKSNQYSEAILNSIQMNNYQTHG